MKIYTDGVYKILAIDEEPQEFVYCYEFEKSPFPKSWSKEKILKYHYFWKNGVEKIYG
jgi:hypothetical protein